VEHAWKFPYPEFKLTRILKRLGDKVPTLQNFFPKNKTSLLSTNATKYLQNIILKRDQINNGFLRAEEITIIVDLGQAKSMKVVENHLDYLICKKFAQPRA